MQSKPIQSQKEADEVRNYLIETTMRVEEIDRAQAAKRVDALFKSGILDGGSAENPETQRKIDKFMRTPID